MDSDIPLYFVAFVFTLAAIGVTLAVIVPAARERRRAEAEARRRRVSPTGSDLDSYLGDLAKAETPEQVDRLDKGKG